MASYTAKAQENKKPKQVLTPIVDKLFEEFISSHTEINLQENDLYVNLFKQVVGRCVADTVGVVSPKESDFSPKSQLNIMYEELAKIYGAEEAQNLLLKNISSYTLSHINTPHPTEFFSPEAIVAEDALMAALSKSTELFKAKDGYAAPQNLEAAHKETLFKAMNDLFVAIKKPVEESMNIKGEMYRNTWFSKRQAEAIPQIAENILNSIGGGINSAEKLSFEQLQEYFANIQRSGTWSPGDQDSKPDATVDMLELGLKINKRAVLSRYFRSLAEIGTQLEGNEEAQNAIKQTMYRLAQTTCDTFKGEKNKEGDDIVVNSANVLNMLLGQPLDGEPNPYQFDTQTKYKELSESNFFKGFAYNTNNFSSEQGYQDHDSFMNDLKNLRETKEIRETYNGKEHRLSQLDSLIVTALNTKDSAQRIQVRQNHDRHREVVDYLVKLFPEDQIPNDIKEALGKHEDSTEIENLIDKLLSKENSEFANLVKEKVASKISEIQAKCNGAVVNKKHIGKEEGKISQDDFNFYQTMSTIGVAVENADRVPRYIIAECDSKTDIMEAFFLTKIMEKVKNVPEEKRKLEIVNLVEYPDLVLENQDGKNPAVEMTVGAMENKHFREHHLQNSSYNNLITDYSSDGKTEQKMTVAEVKRMHGLKVKEGDETKIVEGVKIMMGAGSDVTKAGGAASAAAMQEAMERTREALLDMEHPVLLLDYLGTGGGLSRSNPSSNKTTTVQGRSMRTDPAAYAYKIMELSVRNLRNKLASNSPEKIDGEIVDYRDAPLAKNITTEDRILIAQSNLGNMFGLPANDDIYQKHTKERTEKMIRKYQKDIYGKPEFNALISSSANPFVALTQYAARPLKRLGTADGEVAVFPPQIKVDGLRAIGFAAALNVAGNTAPLFYGASEYLTGDDVYLKQMYMYDPKAQDTINRATYGVIMADMDTAWKYLGYDKGVPDMKVVQELANKPVSENKEENAKICMAKIQIEHEEVSRKLLKLHCSLTHEVAPKPRNGKEASDMLLQKLPITLREQLESDRTNTKEPREALAKLFNDIKNGNEVSLEYITRGKLIKDEQLAELEKFADETGIISDKKIIENKEYESFVENGAIDLNKIKRGEEIFRDTIYPAMGTVGYECFEHTPRGYTSPQWVMETHSKINSQQRAA